MTEPEPGLPVFLVISLAIQGFVLNVSNDLSFLSADVNFALELSDLRHRHGFHIILVHKNQASEALLHHANELIRFEEFISDLPPRLPLKIPVSGFVLPLLVSSGRFQRLRGSLQQGSLGLG